MRATTKHINCRNLTHNLQVLMAHAPNSQCVAVVKANAYGSEATAVYSALASAHLFATASIEEAMALRAAGADKPILLLEGPFEPSDIVLADEHGFECMVATATQLHWLVNASVTFARVWFKYDTGMGRLGFQAQDAEQAMSQLLTRYAPSQIVLSTHFSSADLPDAAITAVQIARFDAFAKQYPDCKQSLCNSAGILRFPEAHRDFIRPGIALYGASPFAETQASDHDLRPVMTLKTRVLSVKHFLANDPIGYAQTYRMPTDGYIAICEIGYADGYSRFIPTGTPVVIKGKQYPLVGRVAMDMIAVLVDDSVGVGDAVICWGESLPIEIVCEHAGTIPHQLLTTVTERVKKCIQTA
ncbi:alanine racemase [Ostreibacterium oceani]|uniref:Alanine racemase n=1 Tax=Ostreibacterium oceani TaxID=2654998 RepID=A0A6N7EWT5_9GAMM|nr:alanine racemase [Ostreibacterium oceani]MPV85587.1 alanine racemase [Ostreibacterium oceani]